MMIYRVMCVCAEDQGELQCRSRNAPGLTHQSSRALCLCVCVFLRILSPSAQSRSRREVTTSRDSLLVLRTRTNALRVPGLVLHFFTTNKLLQTLATQSHNWSHMSLP